MSEPVPVQFLFLSINYVRKRTFMYSYDYLVKMLFYNRMYAKTPVYERKCQFV